MTKRRLPPLSAAQQEIMELVWEHGEISVFELRQLLAQRHRDMARETIRTLLQRMEAKGYLRHRTVGRTFFYQAALPKDASLGQRVLQLVNQLFDGSPERLVSALLNHRGLSDAEAERIEAMLKEARAKRPEGERP